MYCKNCGTLIDDDSTFCNNCGTKFDNEYTAYDSDDKLKIMFALFGFFFPLVGLILFLVYENKRPIRAKSAGKGALIGFIARIGLVIISAILSFVFAVITARHF